MKGTGEGVRAEESGLCDARLDPLQVAIRRNGKLALCDRFTIVKLPAFRVVVDGNRHKGKEDVEGVKLLRAALGIDGWKAQQKVQVFWGGPRRGGRR